METPHKWVITVLIFWLVFGGLMQFFSLEDEVQGNLLSASPDEKSSKTGFIWDMMTFNIRGIPNSLRLGLSTFFGTSFLLSLYVLFRSGS